MKTIESNSIVNVYQLLPNDSHKSFYGKALIKELANGDKVLQSYDTDVCVRKQDGTIIRLWHGWSATTGRHIASFCGMNKKEWMALPYNNIF